MNNQNLLEITNELKTRTKEEVTFYELTLSIENNEITNSNINLPEEFYNQFELEGYAKLNQSVYKFDIGTDYFFICTKKNINSNNYFLEGYLAQSSIMTNLYFCDVITEKNNKIIEDIINKYL